MPWSLEALYRLAILLHGRSRDKASELPNLPETATRVSSNRLLDSSLSSCSSSPPAFS